MTLDFPVNVVNSTGGRPEVVGELVFLHRLFDALERRMGDDFNRITFVIHFRKFGEFKNTKIPLLRGGPDQVLILIADERNVFPVEDYPEFRVIFRAHGNPPGGVTRLHPFPIGYFNEVGSQTSVSFAERDVSVFFAGFMNRNRVDFYKQFQPLWWLGQKNIPGRYPRELARRILKRFPKSLDFDGFLPDAIVRFTGGFAKGLSGPEYAQTLARTKIALCPPGFVANETIRHWEAMRLGCIVISAPLPPLHFYKGSPIIELDDWSNLVPTLKDLLKDPENLHRRHLATVNWWKSKCCDEAVADYMAGVIESFES